MHIKEKDMKKKLLSFLTSAAMALTCLGGFSEVTSKLNLLQYNVVASGNETITTTVTTMPETNADYTQGLIFQFTTDLSSNEQYYTVSGYSGLETDVVIPDFYNNFPVKAIASNVFYNSSITSIQFPDSIATISANAFNGCKYLTSIAFPQNNRS